MLLLTILVLLTWVVMVWHFDPDGFRARSRNHRTNRRTAAERHSSH